MVKMRILSIFVIGIFLGMNPEVLLAQSTHSRCKEAYEKCEASKDCNAFQNLGKMETCQKSGCKAAVNECILL
jgi:hypothetical protein